jgi:hypothetical protein
VFAWKSNHVLCINFEGKKYSYNWKFEKGTLWSTFLEILLRKNIENILINYTSKENQKHEENSHLRFKLALGTKKAIVLKLSE